MARYDTEDITRSLYKLMKTPFDGVYSPTGGLNDDPELNLLFNLPVVRELLSDGGPSDRMKCAQRAVEHAADMLGDPETEALDQLFGAIDSERQAVPHHRRRFDDLEDRGARANRALGRRPNWDSLQKTVRETLLAPVADLLLRMGKHEYREQVEATEIVLTLNRIFAGQAEILAFVHGEPRLRDFDELTIEGPIRDAAKTIKQTIAWNTGVAVAVTPPPLIRDHATRIDYESTDYATYLALLLNSLRKGEPLPVAIGGYSVVIDPDSSHAFLFQRGQELSTYPNLIQPPGGLLEIVAEDAKTRRADEPIGEAVMRETYQEIGSLRRWKAATVHLISFDHATGRLNVVAMGSAASINVRGEDNEEGVPLTVDFDELPALLLDPEAWVPSGRMHMLAWLGQGAPGSPDAEFGGKSSVEAYYELTERLLAEPSQFTGSVWNSRVLRAF